MALSVIFSNLGAALAQGLGHASTPQQGQPRRAGQKDVPCTPCAAHAAARDARAQFQAFGPPKKARR